ncbi:MAG: pyruvate dehydrogenase complex dihydrolipoamide acetyltransferase [Rhodospirillales bacterium]|nr:pyruvate dehydrogenase complex dihydrolipoamide acetyltransferase [Rhodospirillales bacterium]MDH3910916.1 pyruvate dehydrogenase complex dihydrolipoamide acetyltransferase [Rhodospirillales bacterium]MDH3969968.1 pyruvate dehydrogenase complex dihydrolipoamide acetyltransferase [Rhodospirillales bacterium]
MPINILMPALSPTMTEGTLAKWHVKEGDEVAAGDVLAEIETDKATMEVEAVDEGTLGRILVQEGTEGVPVNQAIAVLLEEGEDAGALEAAPAAAAAAPAAAASPEPAPAAVAPAAPVAAAPATAPVPSGSRVFASPLAKRMAKQAGLDLAALRGSGPHGRVVKTDVEAALAGGAPAVAPAPAPAPSAAPAMPVGGGPSAKQLADLLGMAYRQEALTNVRKTIARRLTEAKQTVPHFYLTVDCRVDDLLKARKEINGRFDGVKVSVNDFVVKAVALSLIQVPAANASWDLSGTLYYEHADVSVAVATPMGLITPVVKSAEEKGLAAISAEMKDLAGRAREGKLAPEEYQGGTFTVSNLGMFGVKDFAAIINPPQGCILAVGAGEQRPVVKDGALAVATVMSCTLSVDHRVVDGAVGAEFLAAFKTLIECPAAMLL